MDDTLTQKKAPGYAAFCLRIFLHLREKNGRPAGETMAGPCYPGKGSSLKGTSLRWFLQDKGTHSMKCNQRWYFVKLVPRCNFHGLSEQRWQVKQMGKLKWEAELSQI